MASTVDLDETRRANEAVEAAATSKGAPLKRRLVTTGMVGLLVFAGVFIWAAVNTPDGSGVEKKEKDTAAPYVSPASKAPEKAPIASRPVAPPAENTERWNYMTRPGDSCWAIAERAALGDPGETRRFWVAIARLNPDLCPIDRITVLAPGRLIQMPPEIERGILSNP